MSRLGVAQRAEPTDDGATARPRTWSKRALRLTPVVLTLLLAAIFLSPSGSLLSSGALPGAADHPAVPATFLGYNVTFRQTGLPFGTNWSVTLNGNTLYSTYPRIRFPEIPNGTYPFTVATASNGYAPTPNNGNVTVAGVSPPNVNIAFAAPPGVYSATFTQTGLPFGTAWGVTFNGTYYVSNRFGNVVVSPVRNGSYLWNTSVFAGLYPVPPSGTMNISAASNTTNVVFGPQPGHYTVTFAETGLPGGVTWWVTFNGTVYSGNTFTGITINSVVNGTYSWNVSYTGYSAVPSTGPMVINGAGSTTNIVFTPIPGEYAVAFTEGGLPFGVTWWVTFNTTVYSGNTLTGITINGVVNGSYSWNVSYAGYTATPASATMSINGTGTTTAITFTAIPGEYLASFTEGGLPGGTTWAVVFNGTTHSATSPGAVQITGVKNGSYAWSAVPVPGYSAAPASGTMNITGVDNTTRITFTKLLPGQYSVVFGEIGLPSGTTWSVTFNGTTLSSSAPTSMMFTSGNGNWGFNVGSVTGYSASPASGTVAVSGKTAWQNITFSSGPPTYSATFTEKNLATGTNWSVTLQSTTLYSTTASIIFSGLVDQTYSFTVASLGRWAPTPASGSLTINGANVQQAVNFTLGPMSYSVTFVPKGLPAAQSWSLSLNKVSQTSANAGNIVFSEANGTFPFVVTAITGFVLSPASGNVTVNGANVQQNITADRAYGVTFTESGLPAGGSWTVVLNGVSTPSTATTAVFSMANGTYDFTVAGPSGYTATPSSGKVTVNGASATQAVSFAKSNSGTTQKSTNPLASGWGLFAVIAVVVILLVVLLALLLLRRRKSGSSGPSGPFAEDAAAGAAVAGSASESPPSASDDNPPAPEESSSETPAAESSDSSATPSEGESSSEPSSSGDSPPSSEPSSGEGQSSTDSSEDFHETSP